MDGRPPGYATSVFRAQPADGAQRKIQKRNRPPVSCLLCRTRKVKCDRQQPCERCVKSGESAFCEYAPRAARKQKPSESRPHQEARPGRHEPLSRPVLQVRLQKLEDMVNGLVHTNQGRDLETPPSSESRIDSEAQSSLGSPENQQTTASCGISTPLVPTSYVGATHWMSILESIHDIRGILDAEDDRSSSPTPPPQPIPIDDVDLIFGKVHRITLDEAISQLPPRQRMDQLVLQYFRTKFTAAAYIHSTKFQREYDRFWHQPHSVTLLWLSLLSSMLYISSMVCVAKGEDLSTEGGYAHPDHLAKLARECLVSGDYLSGKPYSVEALFMHNYTLAQRRRETDTTLWAKFGLVARLAQKMGYHRDPKYLPNITPFEGEIRRRLWFFIEVFDCLFSFQLGMPPIIREDECDTESPGNRFDQDFDEDTKVLPPPRPATEATSTLYLCYKSKMCRLLRRVIRFSLSLNPPPYEDVLTLNDEIHSWRDSLPPPLQIRAIKSYSFTDQAHDIMHRLMLELMYLKSLCVLHRTFLNRDRENPRFTLSRETGVKAAVRILELHAEYEEECRPGGRLFEDKYMLSSVSLHDFLIASMILCLDLTESMPKTPADRAMKLKALGTSYKIWSERKHTSPEAAHATKVVGAILRKVSLQEIKPQSAPLPPPPPQPELRDGSLASLLNNDVQYPPMSTPSIMDQSHLAPVIDFSLDLMDSVPLDDVLGDTSQVDWTAIDQYLLDQPPTSTLKTI